MTGISAGVASRNSRAFMGRPNMGESAPFGQIGLAQQTTRAALKSKADRRGDHWMGYLRQCLPERLASIGPAARAKRTAGKVVQTTVNLTSTLPRVAFE